MNKFATWLLVIILYLNSLYCQREYPEFEIIVNNVSFPANLFIYSMSEDKNYLAILNSNLIPIWTVNSENNGFDFKLNGNDQLTYFNKHEEYWISMSRYMSETDTLQCTENLQTDYHDIRVLPTGGYIIQAYQNISVDMSSVIENGNESSLVQQLVIQEFNAEYELIFEWYAWDHLDIIEYSNLNLTAPEITWMHGNSIEIDWDENLIISNRISSEVLKINRMTGEVIWIWGGPLNEFSITGDSLGGFSKQHDVRRIDNGNILMFDNGTEHNPQISRVLEYAINEEEKTVDLVWEYIHSDELSSHAFGSSQRLPNGNTLINWGLMPEHGAIITEVDFQKNIVFEIRYPLEYKSYKVRKADWNFDVNLFRGDVNLDELINVVDIIILVQYILNVPEEIDMFHLFKCDLNLDGNIDVIDVQLIVNNIL